ncbi:hypothetical protein ABZ894_20490 [Nocardia beijingensis]|uniref:hypothetical protein n=1 Tax=Nocardia beijingensis TaxID=95162 RepID=UPI0034027AF3
MSTHRHHRRHCHGTRRRPGRHVELTLRHGDDLAALPPLIRLARCESGKLRYFSFADADLALAGIDRTKPGRQESRVYACPLCGGWHLTSQPLRTAGRTRQNHPTEA